MKNEHGVNLRERKIWMLEGAEQYKAFLLDKGSYVGYKKAIEDYGVNAIEECDWGLRTEAAKRLAKRLKKKAE